MRELFQYVLDNYIDQNPIVDKTTEVYSCLVKTIPQKLREYLNRDDLIVKGSMGQGNKTDYPWVSILNRNITNTTQKGLYIVYLFKKDMSGFYLALSQGITNFENLYNKRKYFFAEKTSNYFKNEIDNSSFSKAEISLGDGRTKDLGYGYEKTTILSKYYPSNNYTDDVIEADLVELLNVYDFIAGHFETASYDSVIKSIVDEEEDILIAADDAIQKIKETIDPDERMPFGFTRKLKEQKPLVDRTNKLKRVTNPKVGKIDYLKKAVKDIENGLLGEELVLSYERDRLSNLGRDDLAQRIKWASRETDSYGYDIQSFEVDENGKEREIYIEVKATSSKVDNEFFISKHELATSIKYKDNYCLYRVYDVFAEEPKFYRAFGEINKNFIIDPVTYVARYKYPEIKN